MKPPAGLPRRISMSKLPPQYRASLDDVPFVEEISEAQQQFELQQQQQLLKQQQEEQERQRAAQEAQERLRREEEQKQFAALELERAKAAETDARERQRRDELSRQLNRFPRNCYTEVCGQEAMAPLPRLQSTTERAADRTRNSIHQFLVENCPKRADQIDAVMRQFEGREALVVEVLTAIFGNDWVSNSKTKAITEAPSLIRAKSPSSRTTESLVESHPSNTNSPRQQQQQHQQQGIPDSLAISSARALRLQQQPAAALPPAGLVDDSPAPSTAAGAMLTPPLPAGLASFHQ